MRIFVKKNMQKIKAILFDFDGVIADTEPQYDLYMNQIGEKYQLGIDNFAHVVKGVPTPDIIKKYFSNFSEEEKCIIVSELHDFELKMDFPEVNGSIAFIKSLKAKNYKIGLVTSSNSQKMERALDILNLTNCFDTIVTSNRITIGKPNPMCFLLAASDLSIHSSECLVFEDSLNGINAGVAANMWVIGVTTTFDKEKMNPAIISTISDFAKTEELLNFISKI